MILLKCKASSVHQHAHMENIDHKQEDICNPEQIKDFCFPSTLYVCVKFLQINKENNIKLDKINSIFQKREHKWQISIQTNKDSVLLAVKDLHIKTQLANIRLEKIKKV